MESLEHLFKNMATGQGGIEAHDIYIVVERNLVPYFRRKGLSLFDAVSRSYKLMAFITGYCRNALIKRDYKTVIAKIKETRSHFAETKTEINLSPVKDDLFDDVILKALLPTRRESSQSYSIPEKVAEPRRAFPFKLSSEFIPLLLKNRTLYLTLITPEEKSLNPYAFSELEAEEEISDSEILSKISETLACIDKNLSTSHESVKNIDNKLEGIEHHVNYAGIP
jgi:hypothetical protein